MSHDFRLERLIDAPVEEVFHAMTDPDVQREWWARDGASVRTSAELRVGGRAFVEWETDEGTLCRADQVFLEIEPPFRLVFNETVTEPSSPVYECLLTLTFKDVDGKTLLTVQHEGFPSAEERDKHKRGTGIFLDRLARYVAMRDASAIPSGAMTHGRRRS